MSSHNSPLEVSVLKIERISEDETEAYPVSAHKMTSSSHTASHESPILEPTTQQQDVQFQVHSPDDDDDEPVQVIEDEKCSKSWLFVSDLAPDITEDGIIAIFSKFGKVNEHFVNFDKHFAFVRMDCRANAEQALNELNLRESGGQILHVRKLNCGNIVKVADLSPVISNELLKESLGIFGVVDRAVVIVDKKGQSTTRAIVEFHSEQAARNAVQQIQEGIFLMTTSPRPISATLMEHEDSEVGLPEDKITKTSQYYLERETAPRFAEAGTFEEECAKDWKLQQKCEREKRSDLERTLLKSREFFQVRMEIRVREYQTMLLKQDLIRRQKEFGRLESMEQMEVEKTNMKQRSSTSRSSFNSTSTTTHEEQHQHQRTPPQFATNPPQFPTNPPPFPTNPPPFIPIPNQFVPVPPQYALNPQRTQQQPQFMPIPAQHHHQPQGNPILLEDEGDSEMTDMSSSTTTNDPSNMTESNDEKTEKPYKCLQCDKRYKYKTGLYAHRNNIHNKDKIGYTCDVCQKTFANAGNCRKHREVAHPEIGHVIVDDPSPPIGLSIFKCLQCPNQNFPNRIALRKHMTLVHKKKKCFSCDKTFHQLANLISHESTHNKLASDLCLTCFYCGKKFKHRGNYKAHVRVHTGEKPFKCLACGRGFGRNDTLQNHIVKCPEFLAQKARQHQLQQQIQS